MRSNAAHSSAALRGAAMTGIGTPKAVINGKLFSCLDFPETVQEDFSTDSAHREIRITTMIDELGAAASYCSIEHRAPIQANQVNSLDLSYPAPGYCTSQGSRFQGPEHPRGTVCGFAQADPFTGILDDPLAWRDRLFCKDTKAFDTRTANEESKMGEFQVDMWNVILHG
jgi:hypothetical protein